MKTGTVAAFLLTLACAAPAQVPQTDIPAATRSFSFGMKP